MAAERNLDPEITRAVEDTQTRLRDERSTLGDLPRENAELRTRLEELQAERELLHRELEGLCQGRPAHLPRLPEVLMAPFEVQTRGHGWRRLLRDFLPAMVLTGCVLLMPWDGKTLVLGGIVLLGTLVMGGFMLAAWRRRPKWRFGESTIEMSGEDALAVPLPYSEVLDAEARVTPSQRKRGVGSVVVKCGPGSVDPVGKTLTLKNVPEPERLAEWLHERRARPG